MSRRSSSAGPGGVSLFPFLSILASVIGILTLMISLVSNLQDTVPKERDPVERARAEEHAALQREVKKAELEQARILSELKKRDGAFVELEDLKDRQVVLRRQLDAAKAKPMRSNVELQKLVENLLAQIAALKKERPALEKKVAGLKSELARRKIKPDSKPPPVVVQPGGSGVTRNAKVVFIECHGSGINILQRRGPKVPVSTAAIQTEPALAKVMNEAKAAPDSLVLFLIRTNGQWTYQAAAGWAESTFKVRTGKLPIPGAGEIDLSFFDPK